jgi:hypothetical protein
MSPRPPAVKVGGFLQYLKQESTRDKRPEAKYTHLATTLGGYQIQIPSSDWLELLALGAEKRHHF